MMESIWIRAAQRAALVTTVTAVAVGLAVAPASAVSVTSTVLVSGGGTDFSPALSHDGGFVAFVTDARCCRRRTPTRSGTSTCTAPTVGWS